MAVSVICGFISSRDTTYLCHEIDCGLDPVGDHYEIRDTPYIDLRRFGESHSQTDGCTIGCH